MPVKVPNEYWTPEDYSAPISSSSAYAAPPSQTTAYPAANPQKKVVAPPDMYPPVGNEQLSESFIAAISGFNFLELGSEATGLGGEKKPTNLAAPWVSEFLSERSTSVDSGVSNGVGSDHSVPIVAKDHYAPADQVWGMPMSQKGYTKSVSKESIGNEHLSNRPGEPPRTTLMIRNIPRKYSQRQLLTDLNEAYAFTHGVDFFYLPTDLGTGRNLGYCFVNFLRPEDAEAVKQTLHKFRLFNAAKSGLSIGYADVQGFEQNLRNVRRSLMHRIKNREYRPLVAGPDGDLVPVTN
jgi:hypothetical protein